MTTKFKTRDEWFQAFTDKARPIFSDKAGLTIPEVRASVGFTSKGARGNAIGECFHAESTKDNVVAIFVDPKLESIVEIAETLTHELIHACGIFGHKKDFADAMNAVGLVGKPTSTEPGPEWHEWADAVIEELGHFPHSPIVLDPKKKKQTTRMIKCECEDCGFIFRTTVTWIDAVDDNLSCPDKTCEGNVVLG